MSNRSQHPRDQLMATMGRIYAQRMTTTSGGNLSVRDDSGEIWITPARVDKGRLSGEDIVRVRVDGSFEGRHPPSSELPFHQAIYAARPDLGGIVHAHPTALVAFSISKQVPDTRVFHGANATCGTPGFAPYALPGSQLLGDRIASQFATGHDAVILENHGVVAGGETLQRAFERFETLEFTAQTILRARAIGEPRALSEDELALYERREMLPEFDARAPDETETGLREQLCDFVQRGYQQQLMISSIGSFSARLSGDRFLMTPYRIDRFALVPEDLILVDAGRRERPKRAGRETAIHRSIYLAHPEVGAVVNAFPVNGSAFSIVGRAIDSRLIPESYIVLRDTGCIPHDAQFGSGAEMVAHLSPQCPTAVVCSGGVMAIGATVLEAFDRLEVLESTASALISAGVLGEIGAMPEEVVDELRRVFLAEK